MMRKFKVAYTATGKLFSDETIEATSIDQAEALAWERTSTGRVVWAFDISEDPDNIEVNITEEEA